MESPVIWDAWRSYGVTVINFLAAPLYVFLYLFLKH